MPRYYSVKPEDRECFTIIRSQSDFFALRKDHMANLHRAGTFDTRGMVEDFHPVTMEFGNPGLSRRTVKAALQAFRDGHAPKRMGRWSFGITNTLASIKTDPRSLKIYIGCQQFTGFSLRALFKWAGVTPIINLGINMIDGSAKIWK